VVIEIAGWAGDMALLKSKKAEWNSDLSGKFLDEDEDNGIIDTNVEEWKQARCCRQTCAHILSRVSHPMFKCSL
jgi:hypothetical protein